MWAFPFAPRLGQRAWTVPEARGASRARPFEPRNQNDEEAAQRSLDFYGPSSFY